MHIVTLLTAFADSDEVIEVARARHKFLGNSLHVASALQRKIRSSDLHRFRRVDSHVESVSCNHLPFLRRIVEVWLIAIKRNIKVFRNLIHSFILLFNHLIFTQRLNKVDIFA